MLKGFWVAVLLTLLIALIHTCIVTGFIVNIPGIGPKYLGIVSMGKMENPLYEIPVRIYAFVGDKALRIEAVQKMTFNVYRHVIPELNELDSATEEIDFSISRYLFNVKLLNGGIWILLVLLVVLTVAIRLKNGKSKRKKKKRAKKK